jgi:hypothetical protein
MLLTLDDPMVQGIQGLAPNEFLRSIAKASAIAQGPLGANRQLERRAVVSVLRLSNGMAYLPEKPVDVTQPITVEIKPIAADLYSVGGQTQIYHDAWGRGLHYHHYNNGASSASRANEWVTLDSSWVRFDAALNRLSVGVGPMASIPTASNRVSYSARVSYVAGFDFSPASENPNVLAMKAALLDMIAAGEAQYEGISEFTVDDFYKIKINQSAVTSVNDSALEVFRAFRL